MGPTLIFHCDISGQGQRSRSKVKYVTLNDDISLAHRIFNIWPREMKKKQNVQQEIPFREYANRFAVRLPVFALRADMSKRVETRYRK